MKRFSKMMMYLAGSIVLLLVLVAATTTIANAPGDRKTGKPDHHYENGFRNPFPTFSPHSGMAFFRWQYDRVRGRAPERPDSYDLKAVANDGSGLTTPADSLRVTWIGHATTLIQLDGVNILTDPIFSERCSPVSFAGPKRFVPPVPAFEQLPEIDAVVISHNHYDHLDRPTIKRLGNRVQYFVPLGLSAFLQDCGVDEKNIVELDWWEHRDFRGVEIHSTPAQHFSGRGLYDRDETLWCGWAIIGRQQRVYFAGDTGYFPEFVTIGKRLGPLDLAIIPIGAYMPRWFMSPMHVNPPEAVQAFLDLEAKQMLAVHWGTFELADEPLDLPPQDLAAAIDSLEVARDRIWIPKHGETREFGIGRPVLATGM